MSERQEMECENKVIEEHRNYLDDNFKVEINGYELIPSFTLETMDVEAYKASLREYITNKNSEYKDVIIDNFPAPIAHYFDLTNNDFDNYIHRLNLLRTTWESVIYTLYALTIAEAVANNIDLSVIKVFNKFIKCRKNSLLSDKLGWKVEAVNEIIKYVNENAIEMRIASYINEDFHIDILKELSHERNSISHIAALNEAQSKDKFEELYPKVYDLLLELCFLENVKFLKYVSSNNSVYDIKFSSFNSSLKKRNYNKTLTSEEFTNIGADLNANTLLVEFEDTIFRISPFIHFVEIESHPYLCFYKKDKDDADFIYEKISNTAEEININKEIISPFLEVFEVQNDEN